MGNCEHPMVQTEHGPVPTCMCLGSFGSGGPEGVKIKGVTDEDFLLTRTLNKSERNWTPQGILYILSGQPVRLPKDKEPT